MPDVSKTDLQYMISNLTKYLNGRKNFLVQDLYRQMHRDDYLGSFGHIYCHNSMFDVDVRITKRRRVDEPD